MTDRPKLDRVDLAEAAEAMRLAVDSISGSFIFVSRQMYTFGKAMTVLYGELEGFSSHYVSTSGWEALGAALPGFGGPTQGGPSTPETVEELRRWWREATSRRTAHYPEVDPGPVELASAGGHVFRWRWRFRGHSVVANAAEAHVVLAADALGGRLAHRPALAAVATRLLLSGDATR